MKNDYETLNKNVITYSRMYWCTKHVSREACKGWIFPKNISVYKILDTESVNRENQSILRYYFIGSTCSFFGTYNYQRDFNVTNVYTIYVRMISHGSYEVLCKN